MYFAWSMYIIINSANILILIFKSAILKVSTCIIKSLLGSHFIKKEHFSCRSRHYTYTVCTYWKGRVHPFHAADIWNVLSNGASFQAGINFQNINTEWPKKMYTLFTPQYLWNKLWQCLDADGGHFEHLHWIQNSRTSLMSISFLYKYSSYDYRVIFFMSTCVYIILGHSVFFSVLSFLNLSQWPTWCTSFNTFITILYMYMFRAISCSSSGC